MTRFGIVAVVDWSSAGTPKTGKDSIWIACAGPSSLRIANPATRHAAMEAVHAILDWGDRAGLRALIGFDFPFGYPAGFGHALGGDWRTVWARIAAAACDGPENRNNRFHAAAGLNRAFPGDGPFWGNGLKADIPDLPRKKPPAWGATLPANLRQAEMAAKGAQEVWKLSGAGSVGGQALTGIACLERLRQAREVAVWPFETLGEGRAHVLAEVFPSILPMAFDGARVRDEVQVRTLAAALRHAAGTGELDAMLRDPADLPPDVRSHEAAILGLGALRPAPVAGARH